MTDSDALILALMWTAAIILAILIDRLAGLVREKREVNHELQITDRALKVTLRSIKRERELLAAARRYDAGIPDVSAEMLEGLSDLTVPSSWVADVTNLDELRRRRGEGAA